jgi:hypothetical protein
MQPFGLTRRNRPMPQCSFGENYASGFILKLDGHRVYCLAKLQLQPDRVTGWNEFDPSGSEGCDKFEQQNFRTTLAPKQDTLIGCWKQKIPNSKAASQPS